MLAPEIVSHLAAHGFGTAGDDLVYSGLVDQPDHLIVVYPYAGTPGELDHDSPIPAIEHPSLQVVVRDPDFDTAMATAYDVYAVLSAVRNQLIGGTFYQSIVGKQTPFFLQRDASERVLIACNYRTAKER